MKRPPNLQPLGRTTDYLEFIYHEKQPPRREIELIRYDGLDNLLEAMARKL